MQLCAVSISATEEEEESSQSVVVDYSRYGAGKILGGVAAGRKG